MICASPSDVTARVMGFGPALPSLEVAAKVPGMSPAPMGSPAAFRVAKSVGRVRVRAPYSAGVPVKLKAPPVVEGHGAGGHAAHQGSGGQVVKGEGDGLERLGRGAGGVGDRGGKMSDGVICTGASVSAAIWVSPSSTMSPVGAMVMTCAVATLPSGLVAVMSSVTVPEKSAGKVSSSALAAASSPVQMPVAGS